MYSLYTLVFFFSNLETNSLHPCFSIKINVFDDKVLQNDLITRNKLCHKALYFTKKAWYSRSSL